MSTASVRVGRRHAPPEASLVIENPTVGRPWTCRLLAALFLIVVVPWSFASDSSPETFNLEPITRVPATALLEAELKTDEAIEDLFSIPQKRARKRAVRALVGQWVLDAGAVVNCEGVFDLGLKCLEGNGNWPAVRSLDRPVALRLEHQDQVRLLPVIALGKGYVLGVVDEQAVPLNSATLKQHWYGEFLMLWKPPPLRRTVVDPQSDPEDIVWLRRALTLAGLQMGMEGLRDPNTPKFDEEMLALLHRVQEVFGLPRTESADPAFLMRIDSLLGVAEHPSLKGGGFAIR